MFEDLDAVNSFYLIEDEHTKPSARRKARFISGFTQRI